MAEEGSNAIVGVASEGLLVEVTYDRLETVYELGKPIGKGKFSVVHKAIRKADGVPVALKRINIFDISDEKSRDKCFKEIRLVSRLNHDNIVRYLDGFVENKTLILVFEYAGGSDFSWAVPSQ
jgi:NIMA (never in mitosis gene a)-related kinase 7